MRKVDYTNGLVDGVQVNYFIKGLNPLYIAQVLMAAPADLNTAVTPSGSQVNFVHRNIYYRLMY